MQSNLSIEERGPDMSDNDAMKAYKNERFLNSWAARYQGGERGPRGMRSGHGHLLRSGSDVGGAADDCLVKAAGGQPTVLSARMVVLELWRRLIAAPRKPTGSIPGSTFHGPLSSMTIPKSAEN